MPAVLETNEDTLESLELRLRTILPEEYQDHYEDVQPVSMGSASLKYLTNGLVAWNQIWSTFCDLAMAGGPPHKGTFLEPGTVEEIEAQPQRYQEVVQEICRGITLASGFEARLSTSPGWVRVECGSAGMAEWLVRAIVMENISARREGDTGLELPVGPNYRIAKEIKNVVTAIAKTSHYWFDHMYANQPEEIADLFVALEAQLPLLEPARGGLDDGRYPVLRATIAGGVLEATGVGSSSEQHYAGWLGLECKQIRTAIWMMRALVVSNVLARREGTVLFVPVNPDRDPEGAAAIERVARVYGFAVARGIV